MLNTLIRQEKLYRGAPLTALSFGGEQFPAAFRCLTQNVEPSDLPGLWPDGVGKPDFEISPQVARESSARQPEIGVGHVSVRSIRAQVQRTTVG